MAQIQVYNVGHGEAIRIDLNNNISVIRDFGQAKSAKLTPTKLDYRSLANSTCLWGFRPLMNRKLEAVLSHAHEDHFNGFIELHKHNSPKNVKLFTSSYIPWLDFSTLNTLHGRILILSSYLVAYYGLNSLKGRAAKHWILMVPVMYDLSKQLFGVCAGYTIEQWVPNGNILWPPTYQAMPGFYSTHTIDSMINNIDNQLREINPDFIDVFSSNVIQPLWEILRRINPIEPNTSRESNYYGVVEEVNNILESIKQFSDQFQRIRLPFLLYHVYKKSIDDHSIVFELDASSNKALFLSDLNRPSIDAMIRNYIKPQTHFKIIKSAHHGSQFGNEFITRNITAQKIIHCCGPANITWYGPDKRYLIIAKKVFCTDWNNNSTKWLFKSRHRLFKYCCKTFNL